MSNYTNNMFNKDDPNNCWSILFDLIPLKSKVLDIGCSSGNFGEVLIKEKECFVHGVDIDSKDIESAKKKLNSATVLDIETESISSLGKYDVVIFADVLEHLKDPYKVLEKIKKVLKKNGKVVFSIPNMAHISTRLSVLDGSFNYTPTGLLDSTHLHFYDYNEVEGLFYRASFTIKKMQPTTLSFSVGMINERLETIGLKSSSKFHHHLKNTKADVFQFVGEAVPVINKEKQKEPTYIYPIDLQIKFNEKEKKLTNIHIRNLESKINELTLKLEQANNESAKANRSIRRKIKDKISSKIK